MTVATAGPAEEGEPELDAGAVILGSSLFGVVAGCTGAAVADAFASPPRRTYKIDESEDLDPATAPSLPVQPVDVGRISARAELQGVAVHWVGTPREQPNVVTLRFQHPVRGVPAPCPELRIDVDGHARSYPIKDVSDAAMASSLRTLEAVVDVEVLALITDAKHVQLELCSLTRRFTLTAFETNRQFLKRFRAHVPEGRTAQTGPAVPATSGTAPPIDAQASHPAPPTGPSNTEPVDATPTPATSETQPR
jgi:hypothetical protein